MKRLIFTLLYKDGYFILSRNFRNQNVGKLSWVLKNYNLEEVTNFIDELIIIDISKKKNINRYWSNVVFKNLYLSKIRSLYVNINKDSYVKNENFLKRILSNDIDIKTISYLEIYDIYPENWKYLIELRTKQDKIKYEIKPEAMTTLFKCRKCGSRSTSYYEVQTRAADEPMTQFITCLDCNTRWKQ